MPTHRKHASLLQTPFVTDRKAALEATRLIDDHGSDARARAKALASISRDRGNVIHFCRWRQIERLIGAMTDAGPEQTRH